MSVSNLTKSCRKTVVKKVSVTQGITIDPSVAKKILGINFDPVEACKANKEYWIVLLTTKTGLDVTSHRSMCFENKQSAREYVAKNFKVNQTLEDKPLCENINAQSFRCNFRLSRPDLENFHPVCCEVLFEAGIKNTTFGSPSNKVLEWLGNWGNLPGFGKAPIPCQQGRPFCNE